MKKLSAYFVVLISILTMSFVLHANPSDVSEWRITDADNPGEFHLQNQTATKTQLAVLDVTSGAVGTFKRNSDNTLDCQSYLDSRAQHSVVMCVLAPGETLIVEKDSSVPGDAVGTYILESIG